VGEPCAAPPPEPGSPPLEAFAEVSPPPASPPPGPPEDVDDPESGLQATRPMTDIRLISVSDEEEDFRPSG